MHRYVLFCLQCILVCQVLSGAIIETPHFREILDYLKPNTLVVLDIDDTLLIPSQMLGRDVWYVQQLKKHKQTLSDEDALDRALAEWEATSTSDKNSIC